MVKFVQSVEIHRKLYIKCVASLSGNRFREAENDCTEALDLDDRYIKAYSRRSTARKELGKLKESIDGRIFKYIYFLVIKLSVYVN